MVHRPIHLVAPLGPRGTPRGPPFPNRVALTWAEYGPTTTHTGLRRKAVPSPIFHRLVGPGDSPSPLHSSRGTGFEMVVVPPPVLANPTGLHRPSAHIPSPCHHFLVPPAPHRVALTWAEYGRLVPYTGPRRKAVSSPLFVPRGPKPVELALRWPLTFV